MGFSSLAYQPPASEVLQDRNSIISEMKIKQFRYSACVKFTTSELNSLNPLRFSRSLRNKTLK